MACQFQWKALKSLESIVLRGIQELALNAVYHDMVCTSQRVQIETHFQYVCMWYGEPLELRRFCTPRIDAGLAPGLVFFLLSIRGVLNIDYSTHSSCP